MPLFTGLGIAGGIPWGNFSDTPTGTYTDANGTWKYIRFTGAGTLNVSVAGYFDVLLIGGGGGLSGNYRGCGGAALMGIHYIAAGAPSVAIGAGGVINGPQAGGATSIGSLTTGNAAQYEINFTGPIGPGRSTNGAISSSITGTAVLYGQGNGGSSPANSGNGAAAGSNGAAGVAIVRVPL